ncbi:MAG: thioredoxin-disulfide reductase [Anaerolineae bacterium]|nr:thioredoxin-disulfide reductase [Anaerolineae bacterium]
MLDFKLSKPTAEPEPAETFHIPEPADGIYDLIILGGGPSGMTAAIYAGRAAIKTLVLAGSMPGGQMSNTDTVENFPGFPDSVKGAELAMLFQRQAERFGARFALETVTAVDFSKRPFTIRTDMREYKARTVIVATGAVPRLMGVPGEKTFFGRGVSTCATCDAFFYRGKKVVVVGGGDSALDEGIVLTRFADQVTIIHRRDELRATKIYQERAKANPKINFMLDSVVDEVLGDKTVTGVRVRNVKTGETTVVDTDGVFVYIGMIPKTEMFKGQLELDEWGYISSDENQNTCVPGVFVSGDVQDPYYRQVVVAAGTGAIAAMEAEKFLGEYPELDGPEQLLYCPDPEK